MSAGQEGMKATIVIASVDQRTQGFREELKTKIEETRLCLQAVTMSPDTLTKELHEEFHSETEITRHELETQLALTQILPENRKRLKRDATTRVRRIDVMGRVRQRFETVAEHSAWAPREKATYLIAALNELAAHILQDVPSGATYEEVTEVLKNRYDVPLSAEEREPARWEIPAGVCRHVHVELPEHLSRPRIRRQDKGATSWGTR
jgi:hypothetical protein